MTWADLAAVLTSIGFGVLSAVVPLANAEAYVVASQVSRVAGVVPIAIGVAIGQTIGKSLLFVGVRQGRRVVGERRDDAPSRPVGRLRRRLDLAIRWLLGLVGQKRWGLPITLLAAVVGIPPLYAVALLAGATRMRLAWFALTVLAGRLVRFLLIATGGAQLAGWWWG